MAVLDVVARRHLKQLQSLCMLFSALMLASTLAGVVLQPGMARHGVLPQCGQQRHPEGKSASRTGPPPVWHLCVQSPPQPHQGAALPCCHVSRQTLKQGLKLCGVKVQLECSLLLVIVASHVPCHDPDEKNRAGTCPLKWKIQCSFEM